MLGLTVRKERPTPVKVPPVPTEATKASIFTSPIASNISGPVVASCTEGLPGCVNCAK